MNVIVANRYQAMLANLDIDVIKAIQGEFDAEEIVATFSNFFFNKMIIDITAIKNYTDLKEIQKLSVGLDMSKVIFLLDDSTIVNAPGYLSELVSMGIYNFSRNINTIRFLIDNPNSYKDVANYHQIGPVVPSANVSPGMSSPGFMNNVMMRRVIGFKNITEHAGATTLIYILKKQLNDAYQVTAIEVNKQDFRYFKDSELLSVAEADLNRTLASSNSEIILVDLNDCYNTELCDDIIYLIEPTTIRLNKMISTDHDIFDRLKMGKIVLNQSLLNDKDVKDFEYEARCDVFFNIPNLDDKMLKHRILDEFMAALGLGRDGESGRGGKLFWFKKVN